MPKVRSKRKIVRPNPRHDLIWDHKLLEEMGELIVEIANAQGTKGNRILLREELADVEAALIIFKKMNFPRKRDRKAFARRVTMKMKRGLKKLELTNELGSPVENDKRVRTRRRDKAGKPLPERKRQGELLLDGKSGGGEPVGKV